MVKNCSLPICIGVLFKSFNTQAPTQSTSTEQTFPQEQPNAFAKSNYVLSIIEETCTGCGICVDRCQFSALELVDDIITVNHRCVGCGVCVIECPEETLSLVLREPYSYF